MARKNLSHGDPMAVSPTDLPDTFAAPAPEDKVATTSSAPTAASTPAPTEASRPANLYEVTEFCGTLVHNDKTYQAGDRIALSDAAAKALGPNVAPAK